VVDIKGNQGWKGVTTAAAACQLVDTGILLRWRDLRNLRRELKEGDEELIIRHMARALVERHTVRIHAEIIVESLLIWLAHSNLENLLNAFLEEFFAQDLSDEACWPLVEIALASEIAETSHVAKIFEMAVALICELGLSLKEYTEAYPGEFKRADQLLDYIGTYLLSVSNVNSICVRLSLLHYFGVFEHGASNKKFVNRVMSRFGHTVLDHLFTLLFHKKSEGIALQFLLGNLPYVMEADHLAQKILHETFKAHMLKHPERFCLFMQAISSELAVQDDPSFDLARRTLVQHLGAILKVVSTVGHQQLARELFVCFLKFDQEPFFAEALKALQADADIRTQFMDILTHLMSAEPDKAGRFQPGAVQPFRAAKRGRRPAFSRANTLGTMHQVAFLGGVDIQRAS